MRGCAGAAGVDTLERDQTTDCANEREQCFAIQHPEVAIAVVHPTVERGHVSDRNIAERLAERVLS